MNEADILNFIDDDELIDHRQALCILREHLSETLDPLDITELLKD